MLRVGGQLRTQRFPRFFLLVGIPVASTGRKRAAVCSSAGESNTIWSPHSEDALLHSQSPASEPHRGKMRMDTGSL